MCFKKLTVGIDPASVTGWAISDGANVIHSGVIDLLRVSKLQHFEFHHKFMEALDNIAGLINADEVTVLVENSVYLQFTGRRLVEILIGLVICVRMWCVKNRYKYSECYPSTLKAEFAGNGKATKDQMVIAAKKYKPSVTDHNEADAIGLSQLARKFNTDIFMLTHSKTI